MRVCGVPVRGVSAAGGGSPSRTRGAVQVQEDGDARGDSCQFIKHYFVTDLCPCNPRNQVQREVNNVNSM